MAFNPFTSFRKYQKFWMATVLLLCMVTFVLCTGVGGDFSQRILDWFRSTGGNKMARLDGRIIYMTELATLKDQRIVAERFARKAFEVLDRNVTDVILGKDKVTKEQEPLLVQAELIKLNVAKILQKKFYWETGTKLEDLVDFLMWRNVADRLNIELTDDSVYALFEQDTFGQVFSKGEARFFPSWQTNEVFREATGSSRNVTWSTVLRALRDEYRVRLAKLAAIEAQVHAYQGRRDKAYAAFKASYLPEYPWPIVPDVRSPLAPQEIWDFFRKTRAEHDVALVPVKAHDFAATLAKPTPQELESFYRERRKTAYDPAAPESGLRMPQKIKAELVMGDPQTPDYQRPAKTLTLLGMYAPMLNRAAPAVATAVELAAIGPGRETKVEILLTGEGKRFLTDELADNRWVWTLYQKHGRSKGTLEGTLHIVNGPLLPGPSALTSVALYQAASLRRFENDRENIVVFERERTNRARLAGGLVQLAGVPTPLPPQLLYEAWRPAALAEIRSRLQKTGVNNLAIRWAQRNMEAARVKLEKAKANPLTMQLKVAEVVSTYGLVRASTQDYHDRFTIDKAPELKPLLESYQKYFPQMNYIEGRLGTAGELKEDQFYRLFFDSEPFSVASREYYVRPWPPAEVILPPAWRPKPEEMESTPDADLTQKMVRFLREGGERKTINFFEIAEKPILFWKTEDVPAMEPPDLAVAKLPADLQKRVEDLWRLEKAREAKALPKAQEIAEILQKTASDNLTRIAEAEAKKLGREPVILRGVAHLAAVNLNPEVRRYRDFRLPKDTFEYPRDDMVKEILTLIDAKEPIDTADTAHDKQLNDINKSIFEKSKGLNKQIQLLANKPRTTYYVAVVVNSSSTNMMVADFQRAYKNALGGRDEFTYRAHNELGKAYLEEVTAQIRRQQDYEILATKEDRKSFE